VCVPCLGVHASRPHAAGPAAADLLAAATGLWHPALIHAMQELPGWHPAEEPPDPGELDGELVVIPSSSRERMAPDWVDRLRASAPQNPPPVDAVPSRRDTVAMLLSASAVEPGNVTEESVANFLAPGYAHL